MKFYLFLESSFSNLYHEKKPDQNIFQKVFFSLVNLPVPPNLTIMWNFGSLLGTCWAIQVLSGLLLACHYTPDVAYAFDSVIYIMREVNNGWLIRSIHVNGASAFFVCIYIHIARGIFYHSFFKKHTWLVGCSILLLLMMIAFTGYVLPWGQMSYWGATVITNLASAIPYIGNDLVEWMWGGFCVGNATLKRFFVVHFIAPFLLLALSGVHIFYLHETGSSNPLGVDSDAEAVPFHSFYTLKDLVGVVVLIWVLGVICLCYPDFFSDPINFNPADPLKTPTHIQPEWYFLFAYAILRSIPNKLGGVLGLVLSVSILYIMPFFPKGFQRGIQYNIFAQVLFWGFVGNFIFLSFIGACPIEYPYDLMGIISSVVYFLFFPLYVLCYLSWDYVLMEMINPNMGKSSSFSVFAYMREAYLKVRNTITSWWLTPL
uniref:Cytochrome b n=1 Tax=Mactra chinensis TaxID=339787 RepID=A0A0A0QDY3_MACCH|nr:cytochrome b [Mactra chinensis]AII19513.1 cytochrome b [Mactra chinensis]WLS55674.1 cytochrome b [Mactra chinensis]